MHILFLILITFVAIWVFYDSKASGYSILFSYLWTFGVLFFPLFVLPVYFLQKIFKLKLFTNFQIGKKELVLCSKCGKENNNLSKTCSYCNNELII